MNAEDMAALRKPFEKSQIGKLPKGGQMLDFVGHAVVTARLLSVDPEWTWEPMGYDPQGLPATDAGGNLWIKLTICGVTRIGVGDGTSAKIAIGDAIRNAAMRFGVALDLWAKQDLEGTHEPPQAPPPAVEQTPLQAAKSRAWHALKVLHPTWDDAALTAEITKRLATAGTAKFADATITQWQTLADEWSAA